MNSQVIMESGKIYHEFCAISYGVILAQVRHLSCVLEVWKRQFRDIDLAQMAGPAGD